MNSDQRHARANQRLERVHHPFLDAADVGNHRIDRQMRNHRGERFRKGHHRRRKYHEIRAARRLCRIARRNVDQPARQSNVEIRLRAPQTDNPLDQPMFTCDQRERAANQPHSANRHLPKQYRHRFISNRGEEFVEEPKPL